MTSIEVSLISIGGTIAMTTTGNQPGVSPTLNGSDLIRSLPQIDKSIHLRAISPYTIPSVHIGFRQMETLAGQIHQLAAENPRRGIVVTMGTDALEEIAYFLNVSFQHANPLIITGAMRSPTQTGADGTRNLMDSITCAASTACRNLGAVVVMNGEIHAAADVTKAHTSDVSSFRSPNNGPLGYVQEGKIKLHRSPLQQERISLEQLDDSVALIRCTIGDEGKAMMQLLESGTRGFVVEGFGAGHVSPGMKSVIQKSIEKGVPVVMVSRCFSGDPLRGTYDYEGSEIDLQTIGVLFSDRLTGPKTRIKLSLLLGNPKTENRLGEFFPSPE